MSAIWTHMGVNRIAKTFRAHTTAFVMWAMHLMWMGSHARVSSLWWLMC